VIVFLGFAAGKTLGIKEMGLSLASPSPSTPRSCAACWFPPP
jgi:hypothetical protein